MDGASPYMQHADSTTAVFIKYSVLVKNVIQRTGSEEVKAFRNLSCYGSLKR